MSDRCVLRTSEGHALRRASQCASLAHKSVPCWVHKQNTRRELFYLIENKRQYLFDPLIGTKKMYSKATA